MERPISKSFTCDDPPGYGDGVYCLMAKLIDRGRSKRWTEFAECDCVQCATGYRMVWGEERQSATLTVAKPKS
jgi:hypothetical protein